MPPIGHPAGRGKEVYKRPRQLLGWSVPRKTPRIIMKVLAALLALAGVAAANSAFRFSDGYLDVLGAEPVQAFDCAGRSYGYYADVSSDCRVFHVCLPVSDDLGDLVETAHFSFFCGNQTVFSQESLTCAHPQEAFPCDQAETLFDSVNALFGVIPEEK
ncbi:uncharacterized protein LOC122259606 isoform X2 [Penaeus japonicus]|uniref:uncharacterized protein LOC122259606 isoform X2 n=1 Tax=Penaeus japonicus TaxID=27405 RepID=UPI001C710A5A|nr:uncharacterized protein LOC122259606 isoform X2 [Penaeus japonicus]